MRYDTVHNIEILKASLATVSVKGKLVDMGWWCDIPYMNLRVAKMLKEHGAVGMLVGHNPLNADEWGLVAEELPDFLIIVRKTPLELGLLFEKPPAAEKEESK